MPFDVRRSARDGNEAASVVAVEVGLCARLRLIDGAGKEAAGGIDAAVVEAAGALVLRVVGELRLDPAVRVEEPQARAQPGNEAAPRLRPMQPISSGTAMVVTCPRSDRIDAGPAP